MFVGWALLLLYVIYCVLFCGGWVVGLVFGILSLWWCVYVDVCVVWFWYLLGCLVCLAFI